MSPVYAAIHCYNNLHMLNVSDTAVCLGLGFYNKGIKFLGLS